MSTSSAATSSLLTALDTLRVVLARLGSEHDLAQLYTAAVNEAAAFFKVKQCALILIDPETGSPHFHHPMIGLNAAQEEALQIIGGKHLGEWFPGDWPASGVARLRNPEYATLFDANLAHILDVQDVLFAGMRADGRLLGVLRVANRVDGADFAPEDIHLLGLFAGQLAMMINGLLLLGQNQRLYAGMADAARENARLFQQTQLHLQQAEQRSLELALLNQVTAAINSALGLNEVLNLILEQMRRFVPFDQGTVALLEGHDLCVVGASGFPEGAPVLEMRYPYDGYPLNQSVIEQQQVVVVSDVEHDPRWIMKPGQIYMGAWMGVPLVHRGKTIGILSLTSWQAKSYSVEDRQLVVAIAEQAALAIERARLLEEMQGHVRHAEQHSQELALLNRISTRLSASLDVNDVMKIMVRELGDALHVGQVGLILLDWPSGYGRLVAEYQQQPDSSGKGARIPIAGNLSLARVLETKAPLAIRDAQRDPLLVYVHAVMARRGVKSILLLPLIVRDQVIGTIGVDELNEMRDFSPAEIELAQTITNQAAAAITNAQLYEDVRRRVAQLQSIQEVTGRISGVLNPEQLVFEVAELLAHQFDYYHVHVFLMDDTGRHLIASGGNGEAGRRLVAERVRLRLGQEGLCGWTAMTGQTALVNDVRTDPRFLHHPLLANTLAELVVPMKLRGSVMGVINVESDRLGAFDESDCFTMETLADHVAIAIDNARLFGALQERARQLAAAYDELKALDRMKDEFVQTVSHELRTPLTFIKGYIELLMEETLGTLNPEQSEALTIVIQRTENIIHLVNDIISLTRSEAMELNAQPHDLAAIAGASIQSAQAITGQAGIRLETDFAPRLPPVRGDAQRLTQVFDNLIGNAIKFSPDGGMICVRMRQEGNMIRAEVSDQGIGIPADRLDRVWERFYQVDSTTTRRFSGTGLGLAIVKRLVEAHHGQVGVESVEGQGSTFYFAIPIVET